MPSMAQATLPGYDTASLPDRVQLMESQICALRYECDMLENVVQGEVQKTDLLGGELEALKKVRGNLGGNRVDAGQAVVEELQRLQEQNALLTRQAEELRLQATTYQPRPSPQVQPGASEAEVKQLRAEFAELQGRVAFLENKKLRLQQAGEVPQALVAENGRAMEPQLRAQIKEIQDENLQLRQNILLRQTQPPMLEVNYVERSVVVPKTEFRVVKIENPEKINRLLMEQRQLEQDLQKREEALQARYRWLEEQGPSIQDQMVEVESPKKIEQLVGALNAKEAELIRLRRQLIEHQGTPAAKEVVWKDQDIIIEVPQTEVKHIEVEDGERISQLTRALSMKDMEIAQAQTSLLNVEEQLQAALRLAG